MRQVLRPEWHSRRRTFKSVVGLEISYDFIDIAFGNLNLRGNPANQILLPRRPSARKSQEIVSYAHKCK